MKKLALIALLILVGCKSSPKYVEGTDFSMGVLVPYDGQLFGAQVCNYLSGCKVSCSSNQTMMVRRTYASTNSYFGVVHTTESSYTEVDVGNVSTNCVDMAK